MYTVFQIFFKTLYTKYCIYNIYPELKKKRERLANLNKLLIRRICHDLALSEGTKDKNINKPINT